MVTLWSGDTMSPVCQHTSHPGRARYGNMLMYHGCAAWGIPRQGTTALRREGQRSTVFVAGNDMALHMYMSIDCFNVRK
jgi:hypothetical protein